MNSPPPETIPVPTAPIQTPAPATVAPTVTLTPVETGSDVTNSTDFSKKYYNEVINNYHAFGLFNSSSTDSIYIKSDSERITLYVPVMLDEKGEMLKMYENPIITGNLTTSIINTEHGKALKINGSGGEIKMIQDIGNLGSIENEYRFVEGLTISMSNSTPPGKDWVFDADAWVYSETEVRDFRLFFSRSGADSGKILFLRTGSPWTSREKDSQRLTKGWQLVKLFGSGIWVD